MTCTHLTIAHGKQRGRCAIGHWSGRPSLTQCGKCSDYTEADSVRARLNRAGSHRGGCGGCNKARDAELRAVLDGR